MKETEVLEGEIVEPFVPPADEQTALAMLKDLALEWKTHDIKIRELDGEAVRLKKLREALSAKMTAIAQGMGPEAADGVMIADTGFVKLTDEFYPTVKDYDGIQAWAEGKSVLLPRLTFNAKTLSTWWKEQVVNGGELPPDEYAVANLKTRAKVLKGPPKK